MDVILPERFRGVLLVTIDEQPEFRSQHDGALTYEMASTSRDLSSPMREEVKILRRLVSGGATTIARNRAIAIATSPRCWR
jgi:hypothetical protein